MAKKKNEIDSLSPERVQELKEIMQLDLQTSIRFGIVAMFGIVLLFLASIFMILDEVMPEATENFETIFGGLEAFIVIMAISAYVMPKIFKHYKIRQALYLFGTIAVSLSVGLVLLHYLTFVYDAIGRCEEACGDVTRNGMAFIAILIVVSGAALGASSSLYGSSRITFLAFALPYSLPTIKWIFLDQIEISFYMMGAIFFLMVPATILLNHLDYIRRRALIITQFGLQDNLNKVQKLKEQQDGDYFLTSLLVEPLTTNLAHSENVSVEFFLKEKKTFKFKKWNKELGGDINISHNVVLHGRRYTVFLNADAMGKSIQGAGGALVLGTVFHSIIYRTNEEKSEKNKPPEKWLKDTFSELQQTFESFDGSMLVSLVLGLLDDNSGFLYYINAEHPFTVLYRDKKASFIDDELKIRKLGTIGLNETLTIETIQLKAGDVIIAGTDGRDDILFGYSEEGVRQINEDEMVFLQRVEEADADLETIYSRLLEQGELTDDIGMVKVEYHGSQDEKKKFHEEYLTLTEEARTSSKNGEIDKAITLFEQTKEFDNISPTTYAELARLYLKSKKYAEAADNSIAYLSLDPGKNKYLYLASYCLKRAGHLDEALELAERFTLREPDNLENLLNRIDIHILKDEIAMAMHYFSMAEPLAPNSSEITRIKKHLAIKTN